MQTTVKCSQYWNCNVNKHPRSYSRWYHRRKSHLAASGETEVFFILDYGHFTIDSGKGV